MTISVVASKTTQQGNSATTVWNYGFLIPNQASIAVTLTDPNGNQSLLTFGTQYTVTGLGAAGGGTVTYPLVGAPLAPGNFITIQRIAPYQQLTSLINQGGFYPTAIEGALDYVTELIQQLQEQATRALTLGLATDVTQISNRIPNPLANTVLGWDATGKFLQNLAQVPAALVPTIVAGQIFFGAAGQALAQDSNLTWDNTANKALFVGGSQIIGSTASDFSTKLVVRGITNAIRAGTSTSGAVVEAVDPTGSVSFQPLKLNGSTVDIGIAGVSRIGIAAGGAVTIPVSVATPLVTLTAATSSILGASGITQTVVYGADTQHIFRNIAGTVEYGRFVTGGLTNIGSINSGTAASISLGTAGGVGFQVIQGGASLVNFFAAVGANTTGQVGLSAQGTDANVGATYDTKGTGAHTFRTEGGTQSQVQVIDVNPATTTLTLAGASGGAKPTVSAGDGRGVAIIGTNLADNSIGGAYGEYTSATVIAASAISLASGTTANITSITLGPGDWDVSGVVAFTFGATTSYSNLSGGSSNVSAVLGGLGTIFDFETPAAVPTAGNDPVFVVPKARYSLGASTTIFLVVQGTFTVSTLKAYGVIRARRKR